MTWSAEIEAGFGDLLATVGEDVQWTDQFGVLHVNDDGTYPRCLFRRPGERVLSDFQISNDYEAEYREADFPGIARNDTLGIDGMTFRIRDILQGSDPVLKIARLTDLSC